LVQVVVVNNCRGIKGVISCDENRGDKYYVFEKHEAYKEAVSSVSLSSMNKE